LIIPEDILSRYWGFSSFRPLQKEIISSVLNGRDTIALLPTGGGKSICFQVPAMVEDGICIVISPLVALMQDQVQSLTEKGIKAINLSGGISFNELSILLDNALYGNYKFLYLSPERLEQEIVQNYIRQMKVNLIAIDEAHCISQWGNDFRPAYKNVVRLRELQPLAPFLALTATATPEVLEDTIKELKLELPEIFKQSFIRPNISYQVIEENDKVYRTGVLLKRIKGSAIVYLRNRRETIEISEQLNALGITATYYHGGISITEKKDKLNRWLNGSISTMVATNAFGMGIDNPHVRLVVHLQIPESIESYFQEAGRAGRDGAYSEAILLHNKTDEKRVEKQFISALPTTQDLKFIYKKLNNFLQIPYGEGEYVRYPFSFGEFIKTYQLPSSLTYNTLKGFDRLGILQLSEEFDRKTIIRYKLASSNLFSYFENDQSISVVGKSILRLYEGVFDMPVSVDPEFISTKTGQSPQNVIQVLKRMAQDEVIDLQMIDTDSSITFLVPREDDRTINKIASELQQTHEKKINQVKSIIAYVRNNKICKNVQLVSYFGEDDAPDCGICSVCLQKKKKSTSGINEVAEQIRATLKESPLDSKYLIHQLNLPEEQTLYTLKLLIDNGEIGINAKNQYYIK